MSQSESHPENHHQWLIQLFKESARKEKDRQVGLEIERIAIWKDDGSAFLYKQVEKGGKIRPGAEKLLQTLHETYGWEYVLGNTGKPIGLKNPHGKVSLEPGSQFEYSVDPKGNLGEVEAIVREFDAEVDKVIHPWKGLCFIGLGVNPLHAVSDLDIIPARRYEIMTEYLGRRGALGTSMMRRSSSVQINLDYTSEDEAIEMLRVGLVVAPLSTAIFGNSPFVDGKESGYLSYRAEIWRQTDPDRSGLLAEAFQEGFGFSDYVRLLWREPLMFVQDVKGDFVPAEGYSLQDIREGRISGVKADERNQRWSIQELFTEARLKPGYIEIRSVDGQLPHYRFASAAFWMGLLYDADARVLALNRLGALTAEQRYELWIETSKVGLKAKTAGLSVQKIAEELVEASRATLVRRGYGEEKYLDCLGKNVAAGKNPANIVLEGLHREWNGDLKKMLKSCRLTIEKTLGEDPCSNS